MRKFKVITSVTSYIWAESREDAVKFQEILIDQGRIGWKKARTKAIFTRYMGPDYFEAPEDISKTRDPIINPRAQDWLEIAHEGDSMVALVTKITKRRIYYYEALTKQSRSISREGWKKWARNHIVHPCYEEKLPPFIVEETIEAHRDKGIFNSNTATPESSIILNTLETYGFTPNDWEIEHGFWAERDLERAVGDYIMQISPSAQDLEINPGADFSGDAWDIAMSDDIPTLDQLSG